MTHDEPKQIVPSKKWYVLSILILLAGPLLSAYLLYSAFSSAIHTVTFYVPGTSKIFITNPGEYTFWLALKNLQTTEKVINDLQATHIAVTDLQTNKSVNLTPKLAWSDKKAPLAHFSLGTMQFNHSGYYQITATGQYLTRHKVYLRRPSLSMVLRNVALSIFFTFLSLVAGALSAIIILIKRIHARNTMETKDPKQTTTALEAPTQQATTWAMVCHLSGFAGFLFPLANIIAPLLIWGFKRHESAYLDDQGKEAINFQISITVYYLISALLIFIVIGLFLLPLLAAFQIIAMIIASIESAHGKTFRYPLTIRFLR